MRTRWPIVLPLLLLVGSGCGPGGRTGSVDDAVAGRDAEPDAGGARPDASADDAAPEARADAVDAGDPSPDLPADAGEDPGGVPDAVPDAVPADAAADAGDVGDLPGVDCPPHPTLDYRCTPEDPASCPGGVCLMGMCLAPVLDPDRWADCGDGSCGPCETAADCPADCGRPPEFTGTKVYDDDTTITVWVHGFTNKSSDEMKKGVYARDRSCSGLFDAFRAFGYDRPCADNPSGEATPGHFAKPEYYGGVPPAWMSAEDAAEIAAHPHDGPTVLRRYALIIAKYIRHKLAASGATRVNLACHSFGCLILRYVIEHDVEGLASENRLVRWATSAGVIAGARLARWSTNPNVLQVADLLGIEMWDFVVMNPDYVIDHVAAWDHRNYQGNSPYLGGMIIHHVGGTDPRVHAALEMQLLDLMNPGDEPNDGIMFTMDQFLHSQRAPGDFVAPSGEAVQATHSFVYAYHEDVADSDAMAVLATAGLFQRRKVFVRLAELELKKDRESRGLFDGEHGTPPAEVAIEVRVRYGGPVKAVFGREVLVHEDTIERRTAEVFVQAQGTTVKPGRVLFAGPVFDAMTSIRLDVKVLEVDGYPRFDIREWAFDAHEALATFGGDVPLADGEVAFESEYARVLLDVRVVDMVPGAP